MKRKKEQVKAYAKELVKNGFQRKKAMRKVNPHLKDKGLHVKGVRWMKSDEVMEAVESVAH